MAAFLRLRLTGTSSDPGRGVVQWSTLHLSLSSLRQRARRTAGKHADEKNNDGLLLQGYPFRESERK